MTYTEYLKTNRETIIEIINDEIQFTNVKLVDVMKALAATEVEQDMDVITKSIAKIVENGVLGNLKHDAQFEAIQQRQVNNQRAAL